MRGILERCFSAERLNQIFEQHAQQQYERTLLFSMVCDLMLQVVLRVHPSVNAASQAWDGDFPVSKTAFYNKLNGMECGISAALVRELSQDIAQIQDELGVQYPALLPGYTLRILDGNCLAPSEKRLAVLKGVSGAALPGKSLVVMDPDRKLLINVIPCEDAYTQERTLLDQVIPTAKLGELWLADRNFCTRKALRGMSDNGAKVLLRLHGSMPIEAQTEWREASVNPQEQRLQERIVLVEDRLYRQIRIHLTHATRDGDLTIDLISDLPESISVETLAALYRKRWRVETAFQHLEAHLASEIDALAYPRAALFGFCLAMTAYNMFSLMCSAVDRAHSITSAETLSTYYLGHELAATYWSVVLLTDEEDWRFLAKISAADFAQWLSQIALGMKLSKYKKNTRGAKLSAKKAKFDSKNRHVSTQRLLQVKPKSTN